MKLELVKTGKHNGREITAEDIRSMGETFVKDVPVTIGHQLDDSMPAYGWVTSVEISEGSTTLTGELDLSEELLEELEKGSYKNWSIGAAVNDEGAMYLHHVAFLGAVPPVIKDLKIIEFGDYSELLTFDIQKECSLLLSDGELAEFSKLKREKRTKSIQMLSDTAAGKLPFGQREKLISFAGNQSDEAVELLTEVFRSIKKPVREGILNMKNNRTEPKRIFSKI